MRKSLLFVAAVLCFACSAASFSHAADPLVGAFLDGVNKGKQKAQGGQGGQNDQAQMFQGIMNQLTQGQQRAPGGQGSDLVPPELNLNWNSASKSRRSELHADFEGVQVSPMGRLSNLKPN